ncbi:MAG: ATP-binding protein [Clostridium sp.]|nr:ATP-binding protein [Clostridium sp.]
MRNLFTWFKKDPKIELPQKPNPWAGLASYEDPFQKNSSLKFYGRDNEIYDVTKLISRNIIVTLYGRSGIGKTSLLNAGVFPELRIENFVPINIRLGILDKSTTPISFQAKIISSIENQIANIVNIDILEPQNDHNAVDFLWNYFARHRFYNTDGEELTPVLVFDQFEELLNSYSDETVVLLRQLDFINDKDNIIDGCFINGVNYSYKRNYRFVLSIREDDLYKLEDRLDNCFLPSLKKSRYRLKGLSINGAKEVILIPCQNEKLFDKESENSIADKIITICSDRNNNVNTIMLSLLCYELYNDYIFHNKAIRIEDLDDYKNIILKYYIKQITQIPEKQRKYLENNLVDGQGRRKFIYLSDLKANAPKAEIFTKDSSVRLLTVNNDRVELIHDQLAAIIQSLKDQRFDNQRTKSVTIALISFYIIATYVIWHLLPYILYVSKAYISPQSALDYIQSIAGNISAYGMSMNDIKILMFSQILSFLVLIFIIAFEIPKFICEYFYSKLKPIKMIFLILGTGISALLCSEWIIGFSIESNSFANSFIGWAILFTSLVLSNLQTNEN